jgi:hypothetical protein
MTDSWRHGAEDVATALRAIFGTRLRTVAAYGPVLEGHADTPLSCLALVDTLTISDLEACAARGAGWRRAGIAIPLILTAAEFNQSLDAFPLEYAEILRAHQTVAGEDILSGVTIPPDDLRRACETQVKSHLVHLRESFMETGGNPTAIAELVKASAGAFGALLRNVAQLSGVHSSSRMESTLEGARIASLSEQVVADVLALERPVSIPQSDPARLFPVYLATVEQLARAVDSWRAL